jgi:hypothetical protein
VAFLVINIPAAIMPLERGERFEDPLFGAFEAEGIEGGPVGGGTALDEVDGRKVITSCDIEVELEDAHLARALPIIRRVLIAGGAPPGTTIRQCEPEEVLYRLYEE